MALKGAVIGYGFISAKGHVPAYLQRDTKDLQIVAVADICEERRNLIRHALPEARIYSDHRALLNAEKGQIDFIDICTPPSDHAAIAIESLEQGLHVLCEKPFTTTIEEAQKVIEQARKSKRVVFPCHNYKHAPVVKAIREVIDSGRIGRIHSITLNTYRNTHAKGVTEWKPHWRRELRYSGGGIAMDHGSHSFYLTFDWLGSYPKNVTAKMSRSDPRYDTEDQFSAVLEFPTGYAQCHLTWTAGVRKVIYTLQGERGAIRVEDDDLELALMRTTSGPDIAQGAVTWDFEKRSIASHWMDASHVQWYQSLYDQFFKAIQAEDYISRETKEAFLCVQLIQKAYESAQHRSVETDLPQKTLELGFSC